MSQLGRYIFVHDFLEHNKKLECIYQQQHFLKQSKVGHVIYLRCAGGIAIDPE